VYSMEVNPGGVVGMKGCWYGVQGVMAKEIETI
jgi:hypothetical protein